MSLARQFKDSALEAGFDLVGVAPIEAWHDLEFAQTWYERGYAGEMTYLGNPRRGDPRSILSSVRSVVCVGLVYNAPLPYSVARSGAPSPESQASEPRNSEPRAWISRYAWGHDYHKAMRTRLECLRASIEQLVPGAETRVYVDTGPVVERAFARLSGIGWTGKNTCLINQEKGSWFFIGVILTNIDIEPDPPAFDRCGSCRRCLDACPTGALVEPYVMDASRCIAYFNIELKGSIPAEFRPAIGANVFGCDICQDVCPWNRSSGLGPAPTEGLRPAGGVQDSGKERRPNAAVTNSPEFLPIKVAPNTERREFSLFNPRLEDLASLTEEDFRRTFRDSPIKRAKYRGWLRNLCVVMGNSGDPRFLPWLETMRLHQDALVREHAEWAIQRIGEPRAEAGETPRL